MDAVRDAHLPLARLFDATTAKILDLFLTNEGLFYTKGEISKLAAIPPRTLHRGMQVLLKERIVKRERRGKTFYYSANPSSPRASGLFSYVSSTLTSNLADMESAVDKSTQTRDRPPPAGKQA